MSSQELLAEIQKLPPEERRRCSKHYIRVLRHRTSPGVSADEVDEDYWLKDLSRDTAALPDEGEESYEPIEVPGKPLSETLSRNAGNWPPISLIPVHGSSDTPKKPGPAWCSSWLDLRC